MAAADEQQYVRASQLATVLITVVSAVVTFYMDSIAGAWKLVDPDGRGHGSGSVAALVLVAHQCVERGLGDDIGLRGLGLRCRRCLGSTARVRWTRPGS